MAKNTREISITDENRVVIDLTDGTGSFASSGTQQVFVQLILNKKADSNATITSADFYYDPDGEDSYKKYSSTEPVVTVAPGDTGYVAIDISIN